VVVFRGGFQVKGSSFHVTHKSLAEANDEAYRIDGRGASKHATRQFGRVSLCKAFQ
jgi:hypothetical protein